MSRYLESVVRHLLSHTPLPKDLCHLVTEYLDIRPTTLSCDAQNFWVASSGTFDSTSNPVSCVEYLKRNGIEPIPIIDPEDYLFIQFKSRNTSTDSELVIFSRGFCEYYANRRGVNYKCVIPSLEGRHGYLFSIGTVLLMVFPDTILYCHLDQPPFVFREFETCPLTQPKVMDTIKRIGRTIDCRGTLYALDMANNIVKLLTVTSGNSDDSDIGGDAPKIVSHVSSEVRYKYYRNEYLAKDELDGIIYCLCLCEQMAQVFRYDTITGVKENIADWKYPFNTIIVDFAFRTVRSTDGGIRESELIVVSSNGLDRWNHKTNRWTYDRHPIDFLNGEGQIV